MCLYCITVCSTAAHGPKAFFEQDVGPGEVFGEAALGGIHTRMHLAQALTHVDAIVIDDQDFMAAQVSTVLAVVGVVVVVIL